ncbi:flavin reductase family protein [Catenovulum maritimum]|uniref:Flavin reductase like domain-containing protein n=1 Tax=Catenovulum maritimum TaxID=1513271 RepID=A0A0J8GS27_9ALTE|nr:flavin reductase family protein [Catenovulum maritimum]KMT65517.1 hypothetical protein XM47_09215 [Catenovulum maritimum]
MYIDATKLSPRQNYFLLTQAIIPRPIAWVLTANDNQSYNIAPYSFFNAVSSEPPILMFSSGKRVDQKNKDTLTNLLRTQKCVVHIAHAQQVNDVNNSAKSLDRGQSEIDEFNIELADFDGSTLPRVAESPIALACDLYKVDEIGDKPMQLVFVEVKQVFVDDSAIEQNGDRFTLDAKQLDPLARLGGQEYSNLDEIILATAAR